MEVTRNSDGGGVCGSFVELPSGLASGLWPVLRVSRLDPVEALRYE
jgi:ABC-type lipoprotein release transport system permease subunit